MEYTKEERHKLEDEWIARKKVLESTLLELNNLAVQNKKNMEIQKAFNDQYDLLEKEEEEFKQKKRIMLLLEKK